MCGHDGNKLNISRVEFTNGSRWTPESGLMYDITTQSSVFRKYKPADLGLK